MATARATPATTAAPAARLAGGFDVLVRLAWGTAPPPWAPGRREETGQVDRQAGRVAAGYDKTFCLAEMDIFADLTAAEMDAIAAVAPMRTYAPGE